jgi:hypothetical protein
MYYRALTVDSANQLIRKARYQIYPNPGFRLQLEHYGEALSKSRYNQDQRARYNEDYTTMSAELLKEMRKTSTAGLRQDYW